jgi:hypothetical protein
LFITTPLFSELLKAVADKDGYFAKMSRVISWYTPDQKKNNLAAKYPIMVNGEWEPNKIGQDRGPLDPVLFTGLLAQCRKFKGTGNVKLLHAFEINSLRRET